MDNQNMLFAVKELPRAVVVPRDSATRLANGTREWAHHSWSWLRPRTLPMLVAISGFMMFMVSGRYLSNMVAKPQHMAEIEAQVETAASRPMVKVRLVKHGNQEMLVKLSDVSPR
jgi:hypothetical protein